jgi:hypothetical protein
MVTEVEPSGTSGRRFILVSSLLSSYHPRHGIDLKVSAEEREKQNFDPSFISCLKRLHYHSMIAGVLRAFCVCLNGGGALFSYSSFGHCHSIEPILYYSSRQALHTFLLQV